MGELGSLLRQSFNNIEDEETDYIRTNRLSSTKNNAMFTDILTL